MNSQKTKPIDMASPLRGVARPDDLGYVSVQPVPGTRPVLHFIGHRFTGRRVIVPVRGAIFERDFDEPHAHVIRSYPRFPREVGVIRHRGTPVRSSPAP